MTFDHIITNRPKPLVHYLVVVDDPIVLNHIVPDSIQVVNSDQTAAGAGIKSAQLETFFNLVNMAEPATDRIVICDLFNLFF